MTLGASAGQVLEIMKPVYRIDSFYDRSLRLWTALIKDADGNQVGEAEYSPREDTAVTNARSTIRFLEQTKNQKDA